MSLINEALKKAQKQRTGESPGLASVPTLGGERAEQIARRGAPSGLMPLLLGAGLGLVALGLLVVGGIYLFRGKTGDTPPATVASAPTPAVPTAPPAAAVPAPLPTATTTPPSPAPVAVTPPKPAAPAADTFVVPNVASTAAAPAPAPALPPVVQNIAAVTPAPVAEEPKPQPARPASPGRLEPRAINFIEGLRVAGIRASATDSKVLMNDRVYRLGDTVEHDMGLRLVGITSSSLTFEDDRGAKYTRSF